MTAIEANSIDFLIWPIYRENCKEPEKFVGGGGAFTVANLSGVQGTRAHLWVNFIIFMHCMFSRKSGQIVSWRPLSVIDAPPSGKSWIRHCFTPPPLSGVGRMEKILHLKKYYCFQNTLLALNANPLSVTSRDLTTSWNTLKMWTL